MKENLKNDGQGTDEMLGLARGTCSKVGTLYVADRDGQMKPEKALLNEELHVLLHELLKYFAALEGDENTVKRLEEIRKDDDRWCLHWLESEPWISHQFFRDWLIGRRALALAEDDLVGKPGEFDRDVHEQIEACLQGRLDDCAIPAIERLVGQYEKLLAGGSCSANDPGVPSLTAILQTLWVYAHDVGRADLEERILAVARGAADGGIALSGKGRTMVRRFVACVEHFGREPLFGGCFKELSRLPGCYEGGVEELHEQATPLGFERNLMLLGKIDAVARERADERLLRARFDGGSREERYRHLLLSCGRDEAICKGLKAFLHDGAIPQFIGATAGWELLEKLLLKMLYRSARTVDKYGTGAAKAIRIAGKYMRDGFKVKEDELDWFYFSAATDVLCFLKGWKRWIGPYDEANTERILEEIGGNQGMEMNVPVLRFLYGGEGGKNLIEYFDDLMSSFLESKIPRGEGPIIVGLDGNGGDGGEQPPWEWLSGHDGRCTTEEEIEKNDAHEFIQRIMAAMETIDERLPIYFQLVLKGISAKQVKRFLKINPGNTHWYEDRTRRFARALRDGKFDAMFGRQVAERIASYFSKDEEPKR